MWKINWISSTHLPGVTVGVGVIIEPLKEDEKLAGRCVLLLKRDGVWISVSTWSIIDNILCSLSQMTLYKTNHVNN